MDDTNSLPNDLTQCHQLLVAAFKQSVQLEKKVAASQQQAAELKRVLDVNAIGSLRVSEAFLDNVIASRQKKIISLGGGMGTQTIGLR